MVLRLHYIFHTFVQILHTDVLWMSFSNFCGHCCTCDSIHSAKLQHWHGLGAGSSHMLQQASQTIPRHPRPGRVSPVVRQDRFVWEFAVLSCRNWMNFTGTIDRQDGGLFEMGQTTDLWRGGCKATTSSRALWRKIWEVQQCWRTLQNRSTWCLKHLETWNCFRASLHTSCFLGWTL